MDWLQAIDWNEFAKSSLVLSVLTGVAWLVKYLLAKGSEKKKERRTDLELMFDRLDKEVKEIEAENKEIRLENQKIRLESENIRRQLESEKERGDLVEKVLSQVENKVAGILDEVNIAYWEVDENNRFIRGNLMFSELTGVDIENCRETDWFNLVCEDDAAKVRRHWHIFKNNRDTYTELKFKFRHCKKKDKQTEDFLLTPVTIRIQTIYGTGGSIYKITAQTKPIDKN